MNANECVRCARHSARPVRSKHLGKSFCGRECRDEYISATHRYKQYSDTHVVVPIGAPLLGAFRAYPYFLDADKTGLSDCAHPKRPHRGYVLPREVVAPIAAWMQTQKIGPQTGGGKRTVEEGEEPSERRARPEERRLAPGQIDWDALPPEIWFEILLKLDPRSLAQAMKTSTRLYDLATGGDMLRKVLQRLDAEDLYYVGIVIITRAAARTPPAMIAARSLTLAALASFPSLLNEWLARAHYDTNARALRLLLSQPEYDLIEITHGFIAEYFLDREIEPPEPSSTPTMLISGKHWLDDMKDILQQRNMWRRVVDGNKAGLFRMFLDHSWGTQNSTYHIARLWKLAKPLVALLVEYGCADTLLTYIIKSGLKATFATRPDVILQELLAWRGPNREFVDPRPHMHATTARTSIFENNELVDIIMQWRGPHGEYVDLSNHELFRNAPDTLVFAQRFKSIQEQELGAEVAVLTLPWDYMENASILIQLSQAAKSLIALIIEYGYGDVMLHHMINETSAHPDNSRVAILRELLNWRGPNGEFLDPRPSMRGANKESEIFRAWRLYALIMLWRGPGDEFVDLTEPAIFRAYCEGAVFSHYPHLLQWRGPHNEFVDLRLPVNIDWLANGPRSGGMAPILLKWQAPDGSFIHLDHIVDVIIESHETMTTIASFLPNLDAETYALRQDTLSARSEMFIVARAMVVLFADEDEGDEVWKPMRETPFGRRRFYQRDENGHAIVSPYSGRGVALTENGGEVIVRALHKMAGFVFSNQSKVIVPFLRRVNRYWRWSLYNFVLFIRRLVQEYLWMNATTRTEFSITDELVEILESSMLLDNVMQGNLAERAAYKAETDVGGPLHPDSVYGNIAVIMDLFRSATYIDSYLFRSLVYIRPRPPAPSPPVPHHLIDLAKKSPSNPRKLFCGLVMDRCDAILAQISRDPQEPPVPLQWAE